MAYGPITDQTFWLGTTGRTWTANGTGLVLWAPPTITLLGDNPQTQIQNNPYTEAGGFDHEPNKAATRQYAIDAGLWPTGDVSFKSAKKHPDGVSWILTYSVDAIPANDAPDGSQSPRVVADDGDAEGATNYLPPEDVEQHDDVTGSQPAE